MVIIKLGQIISLDDILVQNVVSIDQETLVKGLVVVFFRDLAQNGMAAFELSNFSASVEVVEAERVVSFLIDH